MKIIDLLNKIAKGKEVPNTIKYKDRIYKLEDTYDEVYKKMYFSKEEYYSVALGGRAEDGNFVYHLYDEVEIIEEEKEIKHINIQYWRDDEYTPEERINVCMTTINELIDEINKLKRDKE